MIPEEKKLVADLKDKPFALIGVNSDGDRSVLQGILKKQGITWRQFVNGDTQGPISSKWNVYGWPTLFVIDKKGVIRHKYLGGVDTRKDIEELLGEGASR